jgi:chromosome segregation ATPase
MNELDGRRTLLAESIDSGEFFLSQLRQKIANLEAKRNNLRTSLASIESEEKALKVKHSKLNGLVLSQYASYT